MKLNVDVSTPPVFPVEVSQKISELLCSTSQILYSPAPSRMSLLDVWKFTNNLLKAEQALIKARKSLED